jgi:hypothetical protein
MTIVSYLSDYYFVPWWLLFRTLVTIVSYLSDTYIIDVVDTAAGVIDDDDQKYFFFFGEKNCFRNEY